MTYEVIVLKPAQKHYADLPATVKQGIAQHLQALADDPRPPASVALKGTLKGSRRIRVGEYRVGYQVDDEKRQVRVWQIGKRDKFYEQAERRQRHDG